jgi:hypothetical protein
MLDLLHNALHQIFGPLEDLLVSYGLGFPEVSIIMFILGVCVSIPWINIFRRAGYAASQGYLMLIPIVNIFVFFKFAFSVWPIERELRKLNPSSTWRTF